MIKVAIITATVILLGLNFYSLIKIRKLNNTAAELNTLANSRKSKLQGLENNILDFKKNISQALVRENAKLTSFPDIDSFISKRDKLLVFRIQGRKCTECIAKTLHLIGKEGLQILILADFSSFEEFTKEIGNIEHPTILKSKISLDSPDMTKPYYFLLDNTLQVSNLFIIDLTTIELFENYLGLFTRS